MHYLYLNVIMVNVIITIFLSERPSVDKTDLLLPILLIRDYKSILFDVKLQLHQRNKAYFRNTPPIIYNPVQECHQPVIMQMPQCFMQE